MPAGVVCGFHNKAEVPLGMKGMWFKVKSLGLFCVRPSDRRGAHFIILEGMFKMSKTTQTKKIISALLAVAMLLSLCTAASYAATDAKQPILVEFSYYDGGFTAAPVELEVYEGMAKDYGFRVAEKDHNDKAVKGVTAADVFVAAHCDKYGKEFTSDTAANYMGLANGFLSKAFGQAKSLSFTVNGKQPNDGVLNPTYGQYTGYAADTAPVKDGDTVMLYTLQDAYWSDINTFFDKDEYTVTVSEDFTAEVTGACLSWYGCSPEETLAEKTVPMEGVKVQLTKDFENFTDAGTVDAEGKVTVNAAEEGEYYLVTTGTFTDEYETEVPIIGAYAHVTVKAAGPSIKLIKGIKASIESADGKDTLVIEITLFDILKNAKDETKTVSIAIDNPVMAAIAGVLAKIFAK